MWQLLHYSNLFKDYSTKEKLQIFKSRILFAAEDYIKSKLEEKEYFCKCLYVEYEKENKEIEKKVQNILGLSSEESNETIEDIEYGIIQVLKNKRF